MPPTELRAGAGAADITPPLGTQVAGNIGVKRPCDTIINPLTARALALECDGAEPVCILSTDVLAIRDDWAWATRTAVAERCGLAPERVLLHCTQNHSAPSVGHCFCLDEARWRPYVPQDAEFILGGEPAYNEQFVAGCVEAAASAAAQKQPVQPKVGRAIEGRISFNRRAVLRDGTAVMHPRAGDTNVSHVEGPMDPEVSLLLLEGDSGAAVAALMHFSCHPCHGVSQLAIADAWPGAWCRGMQEVLGEGALPMVVNGCCGNLHPRNPLTGEQTDHEGIGRILTEDSREILARIEDAGAVDAGSPLAFARNVLRIPLRALDEERVEEARRYLADHPDPQWLDEEHTRVDWDWVYAVSNLDLAAHHAEHPWHDYEVQAMRIGSVGLVAVVGEPFVEAQLDLKLRSPAAYTLVAHMSNGYVGYVPTRDALSRGGFETRAAHWSKLAPEALEMITEEALRLLAQVFA